MHRCDAIAGEGRNLQPAFCDDRTYSGRRKSAARIGIIVHLRDRDIGTAAGLVEGSAHDKRSPGIALDQQDQLAVAQQGCQRSRHRRLRIGAGHHNHDIGTVNSRSQITCRALDSSEPGPVALDIDAAKREFIRKTALADDYSRWLR